MPHAATMRPMITTANWDAPAPAISITMPTPSAMPPKVCACCRLDTGPRGRGAGGCLSCCGWDGCCGSLGWGEPASFPYHQVAPGGAIVWRSGVTGAVPAWPSGADSGGGRGSEFWASWDCWGCWGCWGPAFHGHGPAAGDPAGDGDGGGGEVGVRGGGG